MAEHYGAVIIPARVGKARDKAKVESGVLQVERWVLAPLRHHTFFSLAELNEAIAVQLEILNNRPFEKLEGTRKSLFETLDKPALKPLPPHRFIFAEWSKAKVNIDYHIEVDHHYYSVPYQLIHERLDVRLTDVTVEVFFKSRRVALHRRSYLKGKHTTLPEHMPKAHQKYLEWTPSRLIRWAGQIGPHTQNLVELHPGIQTSPRAGLSLLSRTPTSGEAVFDRAFGSGLCPSIGLQSLLLQERRIHPQEGVGSTTFECLFTPNPSPPA